MKELLHTFNIFTDVDMPFQIIYVGESFCDESFHFKRTNFKSYSLEYILDGEGTFIINGKTYTPQKGDIFFLDKHSAHEYYCDSKNAWHKMFVGFKGELADAFAKAYLQGGEYVFKADSLKNAFVNMNRIAKNEEYDYLERHNMVLGELMKAIVAVKNNSQIAQEDLADRIKRILDNNVQKPYTINQLSIDLNYTNNHLINVFVAKFGITPYQYYTKKKIQCSKEYLRTTQLTISEIAELLCYVDTRYFSACFKKLTGKTPAQYRREEVL